MIKTPAFFRVAAAAALAVALAPVAVRAALPLAAAAVPLVAGVELGIRNVSAPAGGTAQVQVAVTEPKPISTGDFGFDFGDFAGIALFSPGSDALGVAVAQGNFLTVSIVSPAATLGTDLDAPFLTVSKRIPATAPAGTTFPIGFLGAGLRLLDPSGAVYLATANPGSVQVAPGPSIDTVRPGSADLTEGSVVRLTGQGFTPRTKVRFDETLLADVQYVDSQHIDVVLASPVRMHGLRIKAENPDGSRTRYYSYERTQRQGTSADPILRNVVPLFSSRPGTDDTLVDIASVPTGLALQNLETTPALVHVELLAPDGKALAATNLLLQRQHFVVSEISELFNIQYAPSMVVRVTSHKPIQVMGVAIDPSGDVTPVVPRNNAAAPGLDPSALPPGLDPNALPPGLDPNALPPGLDPNALPPGLDPNALPRGPDPSALPPGPDASALPPGPDASAVAPGPDPSAVAQSPGPIAG